MSRWWSGSLQLLVKTDILKHNDIGLRELKIQTESKAAIIRDSQGSCKRGAVLNWFFLNPNQQGMSHGGCSINLFTEISLDPCLWWVHFSKCAVFHINPFYEIENFWVIKSYYEHSSHMLLVDRGYMSWEGMKNILFSF